jgi:uncharacterized protein YfaT (DUF1175 family)
MPMKWLWGILFLLGAANASAAGLPLEIQRSRLFELALEQSAAISPDWDPAQRDCAGFVRFLFRKAAGSSAVSWKTAGGQSQRYAPAADLVGWNFELRGRDLESLSLETGDILAFRRPLQAPGEDWHLMVVLKAPAGTEARPLVIYHNGATGPQAGIRKLWLEELRDSKLPDWRPESSNPRFIGVFRHPSWNQAPQKGLSANG